MLRNKLLASAIVLTTLGINSAALANGYYAPAFKPGPYMGIQAGWADVDEGSGLKDVVDNLYVISNAFKDFFLFEGVPISLVNSKDIDDDNWLAGRIYLGYNFSPYFSLETGYTLFPVKKYSVNSTITFIDEEEFDDNDTFALHKEYRVNTFAVDLVGKFIFPIGDAYNRTSGWDIYAKLGIAYVHAGYDDINRLTFPLTGIPGADKPLSFTVGYNQLETAIRPTYGLGIAYNFNQCFSLDLSWMGIYGQDKFDDPDIYVGVWEGTQHPIPTTNFVALGLTYKFAKM